SVPLGYRLKAGQEYVLGTTARGEYLWAQEPGEGGGPPVLVQGEERYHQIQFGHRIAFVKAADVRLMPA
ncbi:N-acetylmuramoyl-L-alanine amidase, partial [Streptomyces sp. TR06-5]